MDDDLRWYLLKADDKDEQDDKGMQEMLMYVIVHNESSFLTGLVIQLIKKIHVFCLFECVPEHWMWPDVLDICDYQSEDIVERTETLEIINSRVLMSVPGVDKFWCN